MRNLLIEVDVEVNRQLDKWGEQNHPSGTNPALYGPTREHYQATCNAKAKGSAVTWADILLEEVFEALAEHEGPALREELIQVAAVCTSWVQCIDRRGA